MSRTAARRLDHVIPHVLVPQPWQFDVVRLADEPSRRALACVMRATLDASQRAFVTINHKAEGSALATARALAGALDAADQA